MGANQTIDWRNTAASALDWWHEAGVDTLVDDTPRDWFAAPEPLVLPATAPITPVATPSAMPVLLADFLNWRSGGEVPEASWSGVSLAA